MKIRGWVYRHRILGNDKVFLIIRNVKEKIQAVVKQNDVSKEVWDKAISLYNESAVELEGELIADKRAPGGRELHVKNIHIITRGEPFPIQKDFSESFLLDVRHLWLRSTKMANIMKARHYVLTYLREFLNKNEFFEISPPLLTVAGAEGGADMFETNYFGQKAYLTQSSQLYAEVMIYSLERVYTLAPTFRAEKSRTTKHLNEFWMLEPEMAFFDHKMNMDIQEEMVKYVFNKMIEEHKDIYKNLRKEIPKALEDKFPRIDYEEAINIVNENGGKMEYGEDFGVDEEKLFMKSFETPVFITNFPLEIKAFYMREDPNKKGTALCDDLIAPFGHGEIIGGSERIWDYEELVDRMRAQHMDIKSYDWYLDLRRYGSIPHSGFGLGIERFIKYILNLEHIRDTIPFPRTINRIKP